MIEGAHLVTAGGRSSRHNSTSEGFIFRGMGAGTKIFRQAKTESMQQLAPKDPVWGSGLRRLSHE